MSALLDRAPYGPRDDARLLSELNALTRHHAAHCPPYARIVAGRPDAASLADVPFLHVGLFKRGDFRTVAEGVRHGRTLASSGTSGMTSRIALDEESSALQGRSAHAILKEELGGSLRPLLVLDRPASLRERGALSARMAAAMSLKPLASDVQFLLEDGGGSDAVRWDRVACALEGSRDILVYGFTSILWSAWADAPVGDAASRLLSGSRVTFVHSGGWKKLEGQGISAVQLEERLLSKSGAGSRVVDVYGLVEQVGLLFPLCARGARHVPVWAEALVRDPFTLAPVEETPGLLQFVNPIPRGAPYHSVLTEDLGKIPRGPCACGRQGRRFELLGRVPKAEVRGCANV